MLNYSIIIPHKNIPLLLTRCLKSIPQRDDIEVIVVDDNSNPHLGDIEAIVEGARPGSIVHLTHTDKGAGYARNVGIQSAKGKWLIFADADDLFEDSFLNATDKYVDQEADVVLFKTKCRMSENLSVVGKRQYMCDTWNKEIDKLLVGNGDYARLLVDHVVPWGKMYRRSFFQSNNILFEEVPYSNDVVCSTKVLITLKKDRLLVCKDHLYILTERSGSLSVTEGKEAFICRFGVFFRKHKLLQNHGFADYTSINYPVYFIKAASLGSSFLLYFFSYARSLAEEIPTVYDIEKRLRMKYPYLFICILFAQSIKNKYIHNDRKA